MFHIIKTWKEFMLACEKISTNWRLKINQFPKKLQIHLNPSFNGHFIIICQHVWGGNFKADVVLLENRLEKRDRSAHYLLFWLSKPFCGDSKVAFFHFSSTIRAFIRDLPREN
ncbi:hypothetical protein ACJX0J_019796 [Zea mays]